MFASLFCVVNLIILVSCFYFNYYFLISVLEAFSFLAKALIKEKKNENPKELKIS